MKGSVGTATSIERLRRKKNRQRARSSMFFCYRCRSYIKKGEWMTLSPRFVYRHTYECPSKED